MKIANVRLMLLAIVLTIAGFFLFQQLLSGKTSAYTSEIAAAFLGTMLTIVITAIMLNKQTEIDMQKDRNAKMLEYRWGVYSALNEFLKDLLSSDEPVKKADVVSMQILNQQIAYVGSKDVVDQFSLFVNRFAENGQGKKIPDKSMDVLMGLAGDLSIAIRKDLMSESEAKGFLRIEEEFKAAVSENVASLKRVKTDEGGFLSRCTESDKIYYRELIDKLPQRAELEWGTVGFSIGGVMQCYPSDSRKSITITKGKTDDSRLADLETLLKSKPYSNKISSGKSMISFKNTDVPVADVLEILSRLI